MAKLLEYNATLVARTDLTPKLAIFKVCPDSPLVSLGAPPFVPGQYVTIGLNNTEEPDQGSVRRPMSIASAPEEADGFELYIRYVDHPESRNPLTHLLWKAAANDRMYLRPKAAGRFTIAHTVGDEDRRLKVLVAAGTGLAPFISMVRSLYLKDREVDLGGYAILHGASYPSDLGYREELERLAAENGLRYLPTISRPNEAPGWSGHEGRVEDFFRAGRLAELESALGLAPGGLRPDRAVVYICGLQGTIGQTVVRLLDRGFLPENRQLRRALEIPPEAQADLFFEQYDTTPVIDIHDPEVLAPLRALIREALATP